MILTELQTHIHTLPRQEKYRLIQFIVRDLAQEEAPRTDDRSTGPARRQAEQQETPKAEAIEAFLRRWRGFLKGVNPDDAKRQYLQEKYQ